MVYGAGPRLPACGVCVCVCVCVCHSHTPTHDCHRPVRPMRSRAASLVSLALLCSCSAFSWEHDADHLIESALNITRGHGAGAHSRDLYLPLAVTVLAPPFPQLDAPPVPLDPARDVSGPYSRPQEASARSASGAASWRDGSSGSCRLAQRPRTARRAHEPPLCSPVGRPPSTPAPVSLACSSQTLPSCSGRTVAHRQSLPALL